jgi:hypothetical protein
MSPARIKPSVNRKPAARSKSSPGVRMVTEMFFSRGSPSTVQATRISSGSSIATTSSPGSAPADVMREIAIEVIFSGGIA